MIASGRRPAAEALTDKRPCSREDSQLFARAFGGVTIKEKRPRAVEETATAQAAAAAVTALRRGLCRAGSEAAAERPSAAAC